MKTQFNVTTKKGSTQLTTWAINQDRAYPDIEAGCSLRWRNGGGLFADFNGPAKGIGRRYTCNLMRNDGAAMQGNRYDLAGYEGSPGTIEYRGRDLGEMEIRIDANGYADIRLRGFDRATDGERAWINAEIVPHLEQAIETNREALHAEAVEAMRTSMLGRLQDARQQLDKMEAEALAAIAAESRRK